MQPTPHVVARLRERVRSLLGTSREAADARYEPKVGAIVIYVRALDGFSWRIHDILKDVETGRPRQITNHDVDELCFRYNSDACKGDQHPLEVERRARVASLARYEKDKEDAMDEAYREQAWFDRKFGRFTPGGSAT